MKVYNSNASLILLDLGELLDYVSPRRLAWWNQTMATIRQIMREPKHASVNEVIGHLTKVKTFSFYKIRPDSRARGTESNMLII